MRHVWNLKEVTESHVTYQQHDVCSTEEKYNLKHLQPQVAFTALSNISVFSFGLPRMQCTDCE